MHMGQQCTFAGPSEDAESSITVAYNSKCWILATTSSVTTTGAVKVKSEAAVLLLHVQKDAAYPQACRTQLPLNSNREHTDTV